MDINVIPIFVFLLVAAGLAAVLHGVARVVGPFKNTPVKQMPYESGMDPIHDTQRRFAVRFHLVAIAFLVFDVELLFLYPWAVATRAAGSDAAPSGIDGAVAMGLVENRELVFAGVLVFLALLVLGFVYDWRKGLFQWR